MARIRRRKDRGNKWMLDYTDVDGQRYMILLNTQSKPIANLWLTKVNELLAKAEVGLIDKVGRIDAAMVAGRDRDAPSEEDAGLTLLEFKEIYEDRCRYDLELSEKTIELNNLAIRSFIKVRENKLLEDYRDEDVRLWKRTLEDLSKTTLSIYHRALRTAFKRAIKWRMTESNPFDEVEIAQWRRAERKDKHMKYEEVKHLLKVIDEAGDAAFGVYVRFLLYTACRRSEILYLRREDIDLGNNALSIRAEKVKKTLVLPINRALQRVIAGMRLPDSGYIFQTRSSTRGVKYEDRPWNKHWVSHHFKDYIRVSQLPDHYSLHSLRHTYATYMRQQGVPLDIVQKLLGHSSPQTTAENYDHSIALHFRDQADLVDFESEPC